MVGGGPAGCVFAEAIAGRRLRVEVWERRADPVERFPELLPPRATQLVSRLGLETALRSCSTACHGIEQVGWWARPHREVYTRAARLVDRTALDRNLRRRARAAGVRWVEQAVRKVTGAAGHWQVSGQSHATTARLLVDASGRAAFLARRLGSARDAGPARLAVGVRFPTRRAPGWYLGVERVTGGWWYFSDAPDGSSTAVFVAPPERFAGNAHRETLLAALGSSRWSHEVRTCAAELEKPRAFDATARSRHAAGPGWLAVGDAAACFDPIASQGLMHALSSAWFGSCAVVDALGGRVGALPAYAAAVHLTWQRTQVLQRAVGESSGTVGAAPTSALLLSAPAKFEGLVRELFNGPARPRNRVGSGAGPTALAPWIGERVDAI